MPSSVVLEQLEMIKKTKTNQQSKFKSISLFSLIVNQKLLHCLNRSQQPTETDIRPTRPQQGIGNALCTLNDQQEHSESQFTVRYYLNLHFKLHSVITLLVRQLITV